ncbi:MAG TPA: AI-2E family transporter [Abditibacteriaceae bacterium]|jgi:predicted PurR-regulated permease PerM
MNRSLDWVVLRYFGYATVFLTGAYLIYLVRGTLPLFLVALLLAYAMEPLLQRFERGGRSRPQSVGFVFLILLVPVIGILALLASAWQQTQTLAENIPAYEEQALRIADRAQERLDAAHLPKDIKKSIDQTFADARERAPQFIAGRLQSALAWLLGSAGYLGLLVVVLPVITLWMMLEMNTMRARCLMLVPPIYRRDVTEIASSINELLGRYVRGQIIVCSLFGFLCTLSFYALSWRYEMGYPLVLGLLAALIYIVPYIGMASVALAAGLTAYFTSTNPVLCTVLAVGSVVLFNLVIDYGITPRIVGKGVGLHPLMVIFALLSGAQLGGIAGMILAVPLFASLRVVLIYLFPQLTAPIPVTPPESDAPPEHKSRQQVSREVVQETARAEAVAPTSPLSDSAR